MSSFGRSILPWALLVALLAATAWSLSFSTLPPADFTFCNGTEIKTVDPALVQGQPEGRVIQGIFEGLVRWHPETLLPEPGIAERWDISDDRLTYTFHFRPTARWSNGEPITAHDVRWSWRRMLDPETASEYSYQLYNYVRNARQYATGEVSAGDPVEVELKEAVSGALPFARRRVVRGKLISRSPPATDDAPSPSWFEVETAKGTVRYVSGDNCRAVLRDFDTVGIEALDERTLRLTLDSPTPYFLNLMGFYPLFPINPRCFETHGFPNWTKPQNIVTGGPFHLAERRIRDRIRLVKSPTYWDADSVTLETIDILAAQSQATMLNMYLTGQADWVTDLPATVMGDLLAQKRDDFQPTPYLSTYFYRLNTTRAPLDDARVRKALALAIDRQEIIGTILRAGELPATSLVPPGIPGYEPASFGTFDPDRARQLLAEAGFPGGKGCPRISILYNTHETHRDIAELVQSQWKRVLNIDVGLENQEWQVYLSRQRALEYFACRAGWIGDYVDPNTFIDMFVTGGANNQTGWSNAEYDRLVVEAAREFDAQKRLEMLREAETLLLDEQPVIPLFYYVSKSMVRPYVKGWYHNIQDVHPLHTIHIDPEAKRRYVEEHGWR